MSISLNAYQTMISYNSGSKLGLDVYTRNLASSLMTAKLFTTIQKSTSSETLTLFSSAQSAIKAISTQGKQLKNHQNYETASASSSALQVFSSKPLKEPLSITTKALATPQVNRSQSFGASGVNPLAGDTFKLTLRTPEKSQSLNVDLTGARSNKEVLSRVASALNATGSVKAELIQEDDRVSLEITGNSTGKNAGFTIEGPESDLLGLGTMIQTAEDSQIDVNGQARQQSTNTYMLEEEGVSFEVKNISNSPIILSNTVDSKQVAQDFSALTNTINHLMATFESQGDGTFSNKIHAGFNLVKPELEALGIAMDQKGIAVNPGDLSTLLEDNPQAAQSLSQFAGISINAAKNLNPTTLLKHQLKNTYDNSVINPFYLNSIGNIIDNNPNKGGLLDMLV